MLAIIAGYRRTNLTPILPLNSNIPMTEHLKGCRELKNLNLTTVRAGNPPGAFNFCEVNISDTEEPDLAKS